MTAPALLRVSTIAVSTIALMTPLVRADDTIEFNRDIRPILAANCFECHGFDPKSRQGELRLDTVEGAIADRDGSVAIRPGDLTGSALWDRVMSTDPDLVMPPPESKKALKDSEKELLKRWIEQGAKYQKHWAFEPPVAPQIPSGNAAGVAATEIDALLQSTLAKHELRPSEQADRETLIRRVSFTLTGLPPTVAEVDQFLADQSPEAYASMVDRYLASQHFGEEQARYWLDVGRYADTHGLHLDNERWMWAYRDWVVSAFNQNLPFDQFTIWQLAGDQLPEPTQEQLVATGFNRCNVTTSEGGAISEEWLYRYAVDRTSTTMQAWMGLTAGCAVCHDHKYDPVTQKDFYSMYAFFYSASDPAMDGNIRNTTPYIKAPSPEQKLALAAAREAEAKSRSELETALAALTWTDPAATTEGDAVEGTVRTDVVFDDTFPLGTRSRNTSRDEVVWKLDPAFGVPSGRRVLEPAFGSNYDLTIELPTVPVMVPAKDGVLRFHLRVDPKYRPASLSLQIDDGQKHRAVWGNAEELKKSSKSDLQLGELPPDGEWSEISIPLDQLKATPGARISSIVLAHTGGRFWIDNVVIVGSTPAASDPRSSFQAWWQLGKGSNPDGMDGDVKAVLTAGPSESVADEQRTGLRRFWQLNIQRPSESPTAELRQQYDAAKVSVAIVDDAIPGTFAFGDVATPRDAFVMIRGQYDKPGDKVEPSVPAAFPPLLNSEGQPFAAGQRPRRIDLARWLVSPENPLTARVTVNRVWQQVFGTGLVKTSDDFGTRGDLPSHPELLDYLATDFRDSGWDVKRLFRKLLLTRAFQQSSASNERLRQLDPENRLLARGPRFRLDAEQLRDNALFVSGLMDMTSGGRGTMPYQPPDIWEPVGYENSNTRFYLQDSGSNLYRRSLYCFLKRTAPPPFMSNFDGPNREQFCTRRERSNTPLQALQLMNDVQHFEAARALAERAIDETSQASDIVRLHWLARTVLSREFTSSELVEITSLLESQRLLFENDSNAAREVVETGESEPRRQLPDAEIAAWTLVANLVLNLDETVTRN